MKPVASRPPYRAENGGSEAGRERPRFPAGAERRGLQTRRGQVHHARVRPGASPAGAVSPSLLSLHFFRVPTPLRSLAAECPALAAAPGRCPVRPPLLGVSPRWCTRESLEGTKAWPSAFPSLGDRLPSLLHPRTSSGLGGGPLLFLLVCWSLPTAAPAFTRPIRFGEPAVTCILETLKS